MHVMTEMEVRRLGRELFDHYYHLFCFRGAPPHQVVIRRPLTKQQTSVYNLARVGWDPAQIANRTNLPIASVYDALHKINHNGWEI